MLFDRNILPDWNQVGVLGRNKLPGRAYFVHYPNRESARGNKRPERSSMVIPLNGTWQFCYLRSAMELTGAETAGPDAEGRLPEAGRTWTPMKVPSVWQMNGFERPFYVNVPFPFPQTPPLVPFQNPVGIYRRTFRAAGGKRAVLSFLGVCSAFHVYLNGRLAGYSEGSHNMAEFEITDLLEEGENALCVIVYKWCNGSYLECQDMFRHNGIFRDVFVTQLPETAIFDVSSRAVKRGEGYEWTAEVELSGPPRGEVEIRLTDGRKILACERLPAARRVRLTRLLPKVREWTAETPNVCRLSVTLRDEAGKSCDFGEILTGFKTVSVEGGVFRVNGRPVKCKGVNHHDTHPTKGYALSADDLERDVRLMKAHNIDTVRFSHYPPHPYLLELCDRYGIYAVDEADIESHGELHSRSGPGLFSDREDFRPAFLDRVQRLFLRDRSHPCVILWSLGNESGFGKNHLACYRWLKKQTDLPIHYEGAREWKGHLGLDVLSNMYPSLPAMRELLDKGIEKPYFLCEYGHCMGVGPGSLKEYWELIYAEPRCMGGCIWEFADHCYRRGGQDCYGGDGGEYVTDRDFCADGMFFADRTPKPSASEVKNAYRPVRSEVRGERLIFTNTRSFLDASDLSVVAELTDGRTVLAREEFGLALPPGGTESRALPFAGREGRFLNLTYCAKGRTVGEEQHELIPFRPPVLPEPAPVRAVREGDLLRVESPIQHLTFDLSEGSLISWESGGREWICQSPENRGLNPFGRPVRGFLTNLHRLGLSNDMYLNEEWEGKLLLHRLWHNIRFAGAEVLPDRVRVEVRETLAPHKLEAVCETALVYEVFADRIELTASVRSDRRDLPFLPRFGVCAELCPELTQVEYFGFGPRENESDFVEGVRKGLYACRTAELLPAYAKPQEGGMRSGVERFLLTDDQARLGFEVLALDRPLNATAYLFGREKFEAMRHQKDVRPDGRVQLCVDGFRSGVGSQSCGHPPLEAYRFRLKEDWQRFRFAMRIRPLDSE